MEVKGGTKKQSSLLEQVETIDDDEIEWEEDKDENKQSATQYTSNPTAFINKCPDCGHTIEGLTDLKQHRKETGCKVDHCPMCNKSVNGPQGLGGHIRTCPMNPEYQKRIAENINNEKINEDNTKIKDVRRDIMQPQPNPQIEADEPMTTKKEPLVKAEGARLRGRIQGLKVRIRALPSEHRDAFGGDIEVLRDYGYDLSLKTGITDEIIGKMTYIIQDIEMALKETEGKVETKKKLKPDDLEENNGKVDYTKKLKELEQEEERAYDKEMYMQMKEAKLENMRRGNPINHNLPSNRNRNNGDQGEMVPYTTLSGDTIRLAPQDVKELEIKRIQMDEKYKEDQRRKVQEDPKVDYPIVEDGKWTGKVIQVKSSTADRLALLESTARQGQGTETNEQLKNLQTMVLGEVTKIREEMNEEKFTHRLDKLEKYMVSVLNRDSTEEAIEWKERLQRIGALGENTDMAELKHIHTMEAGKFNQAAGMMNTTQQNLGQIATRGMDMVEAITLNKKREAAQSTTTEPMVEGMNDGMRINYPPDGQPLPPTHNHQKTEMSYQDYVSDSIVQPAQQSQQPGQASDRMGYQQYIQDPTLQQSAPQPQRQRAVSQPPIPIQQQPIQQPPPIPLPQQAPPPIQQPAQPPVSQIPPQQPMPQPRKTNLTYKDIAPDDLIKDMNPTQQPKASEPKET